MSWNHGTFGWEQYDAFTLALKAMGIAYAEEQKLEAYSRGFDLDDHTQNLRIARFQGAQGKMMVVEEYLAVKDLDCDGRDQVSLAVYEEGHRPALATEVLEP